MLKFKLEDNYFEPIESHALMIQSWKGGSLMGELVIVSRVKLQDVFPSHEATLLKVMITNNLSRSSNFGVACTFPYPISFPCNLASLHIPNI